MQVAAREPAWSSRNSLTGGPLCLLCLGDVSILPLTAIKFERFKYCLKRKAKYLSMCLQVLSVCWAFINTGTIWAPSTCAQNVGFPVQTGFMHQALQRGYLAGCREAQALTWKGRPTYLYLCLHPSPKTLLPPQEARALRTGW